MSKKKDLKIAVYAISKNEEQFVNRFVDSVSEADEIVVLDTGSTDKTVDLLKQREVKVFREIIEPWRFDVARNRSLELVSEDIDICICVDLDEVMEEGWRDKVLKVWKETTTRGKYLYHWLISPENEPKISFFIEKMHARHHYKWVHPVHEVLSYQGNDKEEMILIPDMVVRHYPDTNKSRSNYLPLLELSVQEDPDDDRNMHYLGREYMYYQKWDQAIETLHRHLKLPKATWKDERCASMRFLGRCYLAKGMNEEGEMWFLKAIEEAPYLKDAYVELALFYDRCHEYTKVTNILERTLALPDNLYSYINEPFTKDGTIEDLLAVAYFYQDNYDKAYEYSQISFLKKENDPRVKDNHRIISNTIDQLKKKDNNQEM